GGVLSMTVLTNEPEVFDIVELLVNVPDRHCAIGSQGTIVECLDDNHFEVEFVNENGETTGSSEFEVIIV
ncbi:DUF4926 domain-containing protein, partial [Baaleninema simplex]|uniref:DUF4926 domain-containing protein n=1 Tax=Baaleninema simplex TaxID=2862350 RepID=UPI001FE06B49